MPKTKFTFNDAPLASGDPRLTVIVELYPPPLLWLGGISNVRPLVVTVHGGDPAPEAVQVAGSLIGPTAPSFEEVSARKSATPAPGDGNVVTSTMRNRKRVTLAPVVFCTRRLTTSVPKVPLVTGAKVRKRFGALEELSVLSNSGNSMPPVSRLIGDARFSGPGAPRRCVTPGIDIPCVSANR